MAEDNINPDLEIVGLESGTNGRSCTIHRACGATVEVGDVLRLVRCTVTINGEAEEAIKCVKVVDSIDTCVVAYVPRVQALLPKTEEHLNKFVQVVEVYAHSASPYKRSKAASNKGMASVAFLKEGLYQNE